MRVAEIFTSIQGEGRYAGFPMLFIRLSGCTRKCKFCDSKYHIQGKDISVDQLARKINKAKVDIVCWTGGEPLLQFSEIKEVLNKIDKINHLETNGDILEAKHLPWFNYIACSPKDLEIAKDVSMLFRNCVSNIEDFDIKVVTDMRNIGTKLIPYATMLMPLTYTKNDKAIQLKVWNYCVKNNINFCGRLQYYVHGAQKGV